MKRLHFDQYEFDDPGSEQEIELVFSSLRQHSDLDSFLEEIGRNPLPIANIDERWPQWHVVLDHLRRFGGLNPPHPSKFAKVELLSNDWNDIEMAIEFGNVLTWYHWNTSA